jgi:SpoVK/Ycf46/Vps4 family AAA+-type ATPase
MNAQTRRADLVLPDDAMARFDEFVARGRHADRVWTRWGFGARVGYGTGMVALFSGPPGTGKTMLAGLIARELGLELYAVDLSQVMSKWIGETEKQIVNLFDSAERAHAVLLFDEADSLFAKRTEVDGASDLYGNSAVNCLLQRLEQYRGVAVLTTNKEASLDEALKRRVQLHLRLEKPDEDERARLWRSLLPASAELAESIDFRSLARRFELTGGHIKNAAVRGAFLAAAEGGLITNERLQRAATLELEDLGRVVQWSAA